VANYLVGDLKNKKTRFEQLNFCFKSADIEVKINKKELRY
jgi:hypothetical protein